MEKVGERNEVGITPLPPDYTACTALLFAHQVPMIWRIYDPFFTPTCHIKIIHRTQK